MPLSNLPLKHCRINTMLYNIHLVACTVLHQSQTINLTPAPWNLLFPFILHTTGSCVGCLKGGTVCLNRQTSVLGFFKASTWGWIAKRIALWTEHFDADKFLHSIDNRFLKSYSLSSLCVEGTNNIATSRGFRRKDQQRDEFYLEKSSHLQDREGDKDKGRSTEIVGRNMSWFQFKDVILDLGHSGDAAMSHTSSGQQDGFQR